MDEETLKALCISFVSQLVGANVIGKEDLLNICSEERSTFGGDIQTNETKTKKRVKDYLNSVNGTSNQNLGNWCRKNKIKCNIYRTLERCLRLGKFSYKLKRGTRYYYMKDGVTPDIDLEDIVL